MPPLRGPAIAAAVAGLRQPERRHGLAVNARSTVEGRTWSEVGDQLLAHYAEVRAGERLPATVPAAPRPRPVGAAAPRRVSAAAPRPRRGGVFAG